MRMLVVLLLFTSCYKEYCYTCFQDNYDNMDAVYNSIEQNPVSGVWSYTLGESPFKLRSSDTTIICDPYKVEGYEFNGNGQYSIKEIDTSFYGHEFTMQYNSIRLVNCRIIGR